MTDDLLNYYHQELDYLRQAGNEFAKYHPKIANQLRLGQQGIEDPFVSRLLESFAFLTAKLTKQLDSEHDELARTLLDLLYPHLSLPIPSLVTVQFESRQAQVISIPKGSPLKAQGLDSRTQQNIACELQTCFQVQAIPLRVLTTVCVNSSESQYRTVLPTLGKSSIRLALSAIDEIKLSDLNITSLRFFIDTQKYYSNKIYEIIFRQVKQIVFYNPATQQRTVLDASVIRPVGFAATENILPYPAKSFKGFRLLTEYSAFPNKFMYFELTQCQQILKEFDTQECDIFLCLDSIDNDLFSAIHQDTFKLNCTPAINLFEQLAENTVITHGKTAYPIIPSKTVAPHTIEIYQVLSVSGWDLQGNELNLQPYYGLKYENYKSNFSYCANMPNSTIFWEIERKPAWQFGNSHHASEVNLLRFNNNYSDFATENWNATAKCLCYHINLPNLLSTRFNELTLDLYSADDEVKSDINTHLLCYPTPLYRRSTKHSAYWQLVSNLVGNATSLLDSNTGLIALKDMLTSLNISASVEISEALSQLDKLNVKRITARYPSQHTLIFAHGMQLTLAFAENSTPLTERYLFGTVLQHFFNEYCAMDSFISLQFTQPQYETMTWQPQFGQQSVL